MNNVLITTNRIEDIRNKLIENTRERKRLVKRLMILGQQQGLTTEQLKDILNNELDKSIVSTRGQF